MNGRMVPFAGWEMPVEYSGILAEHMAVRNAAGLFDVSHMGEIEVRGPHALDLVQCVTCNDAARLAIGQAQYSGLMTDRGTFVDDLLVHKFSDAHYFLVVNAGNIERDFNHIAAHNRWHERAQVVNRSDDFSQLALQGPRALEILQPLTEAPIAALRYYWFTEGEVAGVHCIVARTGYTGEDGFELYFSPEHSELLWNALLEAGRPHGVLPCGLGARNTLRLEAGMALYGHEIDETTTPLEANLAWICRLGKGEFLGRALIERQQQDGIVRRLVGFEMIESGIARDGYPVHIAGKQDGKVTSGSPAPALGKNIGMAYVPVANAAPGQELEIQIRARTAKARIVPLPFYKRPR
jgi:aminomethyltransferase